MAYKYFLMTSLAVLMVCFLPVESGEDQIKNIQDRTDTSQLLPEATDSIIPERQPLSEKEINADTHNLSSKDKRETDRRRRGFSRWTGRQTQMSGYESFSVWKPPVYQLSRPYFIPIYGAPGRVPLYFPPQSLNINPGVPLDNPIPNRPFTGPNYLPPSRSTTSTTTEETTTMDIGNRFGEEEDRPIWGGDSSSSASTQSPNIIPTRPPRPPGMSVFPPLVHDIQNSESNILTSDRDSGSSNEIIPLPGNSIEAPTRRPLTVMRPTSRPQPSTAAPATIGPSNCVWAIVSCCSASSNVVPDICFEQRGCPGPFWGSSPCDSQFARAAITAALNYYNQ